MEYKTVTARLTSDQTGRRIEGYAAFFEPYVDLQGDTIRRGAFRSSLTERGDKIRLLWSHDMQEPIGKVTAVKETDAGLWFSGVISQSQRGRDALALLADGVELGISIGYDTVKAEGHSPRILQELRLWELSLVSFPAQEGTGITDLKGRADLDRERQVLLTRLDAIKRQDDAERRQDADRERQRRDLLAELDRLEREGAAHEREREHRQALQAAARRAAFESGALSELG